MILQLGHKVFPKTGRVSIIDIYLDYIYSVNSEEAAT